MKPPPLNYFPMPDKEQSEKRNEHSGRPLTEEYWIELMNKQDRLSQYAKERRGESAGE
ncbi:hypothetical protein [Salinibacter ruber]|uniref:hypothetical protein n=1 Tax=Salinibacter ruber TaxID=146919 RepID=UPI00216796F6|nr:hypothetical protein [Salinibacter ruber]MCS4201711.1 hypothetical protein [Salinibacter ruber]